MTGRHITFKKYIDGSCFDLLYNGISINTSFANSEREA